MTKVVSITPVPVPLIVENDQLTCPLCRAGNEPGIEVHLQSEVSMTEDSDREKCVKTRVWCNTCEAILELQVTDHDRGYGVWLTLYHVGFKHVSREGGP